MAIRLKHNVSNIITNSLGYVIWLIISVTHNVLYHLARLMSGFLYFMFLLRLPLFQLWAFVVSGPSYGVLVLRRCIESLLCHASSFMTDLHHLMMESLTPIV